LSVDAKAFHGIVFLNEAARHLARLAKEDDRVGSLGDFATAFSVSGDKTGFGAG
jgi:hypothetical protein